MKPKFTDGHRFQVPYKPSHDTDIRKSMERRRNQLKTEAEVEAARVVAAQAQVEANRIEAEAKVEQLPKRKVAK